MSVYDVTYKTLGHTRPIISTAAEVDEYSLPKKWLESERYYLLNL